MGQSGGSGRRGRYSSLRVRREITRLKGWRKTKRTSTVREGIWRVVLGEVLEECDSCKWKRRLTVCHCGIGLMAFLALVRCLFYCLEVSQTFIGTQLLMRATENRYDRDINDRSLAVSAESSGPEDAMSDFILAILILCCILFRYIVISHVRRERAGGVYGMLRGASADDDFCYSGLTVYVHSSNTPLTYGLAVASTRSVKIYSSGSTFSNPGGLLSGTR